MLGYAFVAIVIGIILWIVIDFRMYPVCPACGDNLNGRRQGFFSNKTFCQRHGQFDIYAGSSANSPPKCNFGINIFNIVIYQ